MKANSTSLFFALPLCALLYMGCQSATQKNAQGAVDTTIASSPKLPDSTNFKQTVQGGQVDLFVLKNSNNFEVAITNYGGRVVSLLVPDKKGSIVDVVLGYDELKTYQKPKEPFFGALIG
ncbi:MAG: galactose-1-epimerase, partial [Mucilaginibacter sp.]